MIHNKMEKTQKVPNFYLITPEYAIGIPDSIEESARTIDLRFNDLADNHEVQTALRLLSSIFLEGKRNPYSKEERRNYTAAYLSAFNSGSEINGKPYLMNNGLLRILITDEEMLAQIKQIKIRSDERRTKQK